MELVLNGSKSFPARLKKYPPMRLRKPFQVFRDEREPDLTGSGLSSSDVCSRLIQEWSQKTDIDRAPYFQRAAAANRELSAPPPPPERQPDPPPPSSAVSRPPTARLPSPLIPDRPRRQPTTSNPKEELRNAIAGPLTAVLRDRASPAVISSIANRLWSLVPELFGVTLALPGDVPRRYLVVPIAGPAGADARIATSE
jgi:hypothetical protein